MDKKIKEIPLQYKLPQEDIKWDAKPFLEIKIKDQIELMKNYLRMGIDREDWHLCWDAAIDLQRLQDKLDREKKP